IRAPIKEWIDRLFAPFLSGALWNEPLARVMEPAWLPAINFSENDKEFFVRLEVPGLHKENLDVNLTGDVLTLSGHREVSKESPGGEDLPLPGKGSRPVHPFHPAPRSRVGGEGGGHVRRRRADGKAPEGGARHQEQDRHQVSDTGLHVGGG